MGNETFYWDDLTQVRQLEYHHHYHHNHHVVLLAIITPFFERAKVVLLD